MLVGAVIHDVVDDDPDAAVVGRREERLEIGHGPVVRIDGAVVDGVVAVIAWAIVDGHEPDAGDPEVVVCGGVAVVEVIELLGKALEVADPVAVAVVEAAHEDLVEDRVVPPGELVRVVAAAGRGVAVPDEDGVVARRHGVDAVVAGAGEFLAAVPLAVHAELELDVLRRREAAKGDLVDGVAVGIGQGCERVGAPAVESAGEVHEVALGVEAAQLDLVGHADLESDVHGPGAGRGDEPRDEYHQGECPHHVAVHGDPDPLQDDVWTDDEVPHHYNTSRTVDSTSDIQVSEGLK